MKISNCYLYPLVKIENNLNICPPIFGIEKSLECLTLAKKKFVMGKLDKMPKNIKSKIAEHLNYFEVINFLSTCQTCYNLTRDFGFWTHLIAKHFYRPAIFGHHVEYRELMILFIINSNFETDGMNISYTCHRFNNLLFLVLRGNNSRYLMLDLKQSHIICNHVCWAELSLAHDNTNLAYWFRAIDGIYLNVVNTVQCTIDVHNQPIYCHKHITHPALNKIFEDLLPKISWSQPTLYWTNKEVCARLNLSLGYLLMIDSREGDEILIQVQFERQQGSCRTYLYSSIILPVDEVWDFMDLTYMVIRDKHFFQHLQLYRNREIINKFRSSESGILYTQIGGMGDNLLERIYKEQPIDQANYNFWY